MPHHGTHKREAYVLLLFSSLEQLKAVELDCVRGAIGERTKQLLCPWSHWTILRVGNKRKNYWYNRPANMLKQDGIALIF